MAITLVQIPHTGPSAFLHHGDCTKPAFAGTPSKSQKDAIEIVSRLVKTFSIGTDDIEIYFSGNKGFSVILNIDKLITPKQHEAMAADLAQGLLTFDPSLYDANQILRVPNTKHNKSGLYKISLNYNQLTRLTIPTIKDNAKKPGTNRKFNKVDLSENILRDTQRRDYRE